MPATPPRPPAARPRAGAAARTRAEMRGVYRRRRLAVAGLAVLVLVVVVWVSVGLTAGGTPPVAAATVPSIEAGLEPWLLPAAVSREAVVPAPGGFTVLGGLAASGTSVSSVTTFSTRGVAHPGAPLPLAVHDAAAATLGAATYVLGGGSPSTVATVQVVGPGAARALGSPLPTPRSDAVAVTVGTGAHATAYLVGGYTGATYLPEVLATPDGRTFRQAATLPLAVRYPAVAALGGELYVLGGETGTSPSGGAAVTADVQAVSLSNGSASVVAKLPVPLYGASAFAIGGVVYVAGGLAADGVTQTAIDAFVPSTHQVLFAGLLPQAVAFGGATTIETPAGPAGFLVGGEVARQGGIDQAGTPHGTLATVLELRPSRYGGPAGPASAGSPYVGRLLVADRGNNRLVLLTPSREVAWLYPSPAQGRAPPAGGFYFPDDAFFFDHGRGIISNQEDNDTIVEIAFPSGKVLWDVGHPKQPGSGAGYYNQPDDAYYWRNGLVSVADAANNQIKFINRAGTVVERIGDGIDRHVPGVSIAYPNGDTPLSNGDVLVSEVNGSWIDEYTSSGHVVWSAHFPTVNYPSDPQQLGPDLYLMTDYNPPGEGRILEFRRTGAIVWRYDAPAGDPALRKPSLAERLPNGLIMVNDDYRDRVVVIDPTTDQIVWQYGLTDAPGTSPGRLSIPDGFDLLLPGGVTPTHPATG